MLVRSLDLGLLAPTHAQSAEMSRTRVALVIIFLVALCVRLAYLQSDPRPLYGQWLQGGMAHNIISDGHWFQINDRAYAFYPMPAPVAHLIQPAEVDLKYADAHPQWKPEIIQPVGEALVLAGLWELTGSQRFLPDQLLRIVLDSLTALLVYWIVMRLFRRPRAALVAAGLYAVYPPIAWQTITPFLDIWAVDFTIAILATHLQAARSPHRWRWLIACGLLVGAGTYFRPFVLILSAVLAIVLNIGAGWRTALARACAVTGVALLLVIPWTIRNYGEFHKLIATRTGTGQTLWEGLGELPNDFGATFGGPVDEPTPTELMVRRERPDLEVESPAWDKYLERKAIKAIEGHPLFYARLLALRTAKATLLSYEGSWMHRGVIALSHDRSGLLAFAVDHPLNLLEDALEPAVFLLGMLGLGLSWRRWKQANIVLIAVVLATIVPYIPLLVEHRYILPASFTYLIWIGVAVDLALEALARRLGVRSARQVGVAVQG